MAQSAMSLGPKEETGARLVTANVKHFPMFKALESRIETAQYVFLVRFVGFGSNG